MKNISKKNGFTIIETMVAVSLFIVIVMAGMGSLLNANLLHQKSQDMRSIMDNLSFVLEDMSKNLRTGYNYRCYIDAGDITLADISIPRNCETGGFGGWGIAFENQNGVLDDDPGPAVDYHDEDQWAYKIGNDNSIYRSSTEDGIEFIQLTPEEVEIDPSASSFTVSGAEPNDGEQPFVKIKLVGKIKYKNIESPFSLQTSVSQRKLDR